MITLQLKHTTKITNDKLLTWNSADWFPIWRDGRLDNKDEFVQLKMEQYSLRTPSVVLRALQTVGIE